jgi:hypothetical protein
MGLNNIGAWLEQLEKQRQLQREIMNGEFLELRKANGFAYPRIIGTVADFMKERREAEYRKILEKIRRDAVDIEVAKSIAIAKTLPLKKTPKIEVKKIAQKKPDANDVIVDVVHGRVKGFDAVRRLIENADRTS